MKLPPPLTVIVPVNPVVDVAFQVNAKPSAVEPVKAALGSGPLAQGLPFATQPSHVNEPQLPDAIPNWYAQAPPVQAIFCPII